MDAYCSCTSDDMWARYNAKQDHYSCAAKEPSYFLFHVQNTKSTTVAVALPSFSTNFDDM